MKFFIPAIIALFLVSGCEQKHKEIEVVPNLDATYLSASEVDVPANGGKDFESMMIKDLTDAVKSLNYTSPGATVMFTVDIRMYIDENGSIDKIKDLWNKNSGISVSDSIKIYTDREKLDKAVATELAGIKFTPAKKNGENVKYRTDLSVHIFKNRDGTYRHSDFVYLNGEGKFFVMVEQMPDPVGGIKAIQNKIHYPELAKRAGIEGKVYVLAFIDEKGNVVKTKILKGIGGGCDEAAAKAVEETKFIPGRQRGKAVKVQVAVPIVFNLK